jgi:hypothetical protein
VVETVAEKAARKAAEKTAEKAAAHAVNQVAEQVAERAVEKAVADRWGPGPGEGGMVGLLNSSPLPEDAGWPSTRPRNRSSHQDQV